MYGKKGYGIRDLLPIALVLTVSIIAISIGADVVDNVQADQTSGTYAYNISESGLEGIGELGDWMPTIGLVVAASIVIGVLVYSFAMRQ
jgi:hypothetical protein